MLDKFCAESNQLSKRHCILFYALSLFAACFLYTVLFSVVRFAFDFSPDEPFYLLICERMLRGDGLVADEWALPQFTSLFQLLPYYLFRKLTGSTESCILFMRCVYIGTNFLTYLYILIKYRKHPWMALTSAFLFCSYVPLGAFLFGYYYLPLVFMFAFATIIIDEESKRRKTRLVLSGILLSGTVILNPSVALLWVIYCFFVGIRFFCKRKGTEVFSNYSFVLDMNTFKYLLCGVLISAVALLSYFQITSGLVNVVKNLPNLIMDSEGTQIFGLEFFINKTQDLIHNYRLSFWMMLCITLVNTLFCIFKNKMTESGSIKRLLFFVNCCVFILSYLIFFTSELRRDVPILMEPPILIAWFGLHCFLLSEKRNPKLLFFAWLGLSLSFAQDIISKVSYGFGFSLCLLPTVVIVVQLIEEITEETRNHHTALKQKRSHKKVKAKALGSIALVLILSAFFSWSTFNLISFSYLFRNHPLNQQRFIITEGPYKGISMPEEFKDLNDDMLFDLDTIKELTDEPVCILGGYPFGYPFAYLYLDRDINVLSSGNTENFAHNHEKYWTMYPDKRPDLIYIPVEEEAEKLASIYISRLTLVGMPDKQHVDCGWFEGEAIKGRAGLIVQVSKWHSAEQLKDRLT